MINMFTMFGEEYVAENICSQQEIINILKMVGYIVLVAKLIVPLIIIVRGTLDFYKAVTEGKADTFKSQAKTFGIRVFIGIVIFFIPTITDAVLGSFISDEGKTCLSAVLHPVSSTNTTIKPGLKPIKDLPTSKECSKKKKKSACTKLGCEWVNKECVAPSPETDLCNKYNKSESECTSNTKCEYIKPETAVEAYGTCRTKCEWLNEEQCAARKEDCSYGYYKCLKKDN